MKVKLFKNNKSFRFNIPETWNELNLGSYIKVMKVLKSKEKIHEIEKIIRILNSITDIPKRDLYGLDAKSIGKLGVHLTTFLESVPTQENLEDNLHLILSILYRPVTAKKKDKYRIEEYKPNKERAELFKKHLTVGDFNGASVFFYDLGATLINNSRKSLTQTNK